MLFPTHASGSSRLAGGVCPTHDQATDPINSVSGGCIDAAGINVAVEPAHEVDQEDSDSYWEGVQLSLTAPFPAFSAVRRQKDRTSASALTASRHTPAAADTPLALQWDQPAGSAAMVVAVKDESRVTAAGQSTWLAASSSGDAVAGAPAARQHHPHAAGSTLPTASPVSPPALQGVVLKPLQEGSADGQQHGGDTAAAPAAAAIGVTAQPAEAAAAGNVAGSAAGGTSLPSAGSAGAAARASLATAVKCEIPCASEEAAAAAVLQDMLQPMQTAAGAQRTSSLHGDSGGISMDSSSRGAGADGITAGAAADAASAPAAAGAGVLATAAGGGDAAAAAAQAGSSAAGLSVSGLAVHLQEVLADKQKAKQRMVVVRCISRLLHGQSVDLSTVQVAEVLPQLDLLLQHMRDRVEGKVPGKSLVKPKQAAAHAASLLYVLDLPAVQAALGDPAMVQQLQGAVLEAQLGFQASSSRNSLLQRPGDMQRCGGAGEPPAGTLPAQQQQAAATAANASQEACALGTLAAAAALNPGVKSAAAVAAEEAGGAMTCSTEGQQGAAVGRMTVAELQEYLAATFTSRDWLSRSGTVLNRLLHLGHQHGMMHDAAAVQVADLLQQCWPALHAWITGEASPVKPSTALGHWIYVTLQLLRLPRVQALFDTQQLQQVQQQVEATKACLAAKVKASAAAANAATAASGPAAAAQLPQQARKRKRPQQHAAAEGADGDTDGTAMPVPLPAAGDSRRQRVSLSAGADPANALGMCDTDADGEQSASSDDNGSDTDQHLSIAETLPQGCLPPRWLRSPVPAPTAAEPASDLAQDAEQQQQSGGCAGTEGLTLRQLSEHLKAQSTSSTDRTCDKVSPFRHLAQLLYGSTCDPGSAKIVELLRHWQLLEQRLLQQVAGTHPSTRTIAENTAIGYVVRAEGLLKEPLVQEQLCAEELQQYKDNMTATKLAVRAHARAAAAAGTSGAAGAAAAAQASSGVQEASPQQQQQVAAGCAGSGPAGRSGRALCRKRPRSAGVDTFSIAAGTAGVSAAAGIGGVSDAATAGVPAVELPAVSTAAGAAGAAGVSPAAAAAAAGTAGHEAEESPLKRAAMAAAVAAAAPPAAADGLSLQRLSEHLKAQPGSQMNKLTPFRLLAKQVHGSNYDAASVHLGDLLQQWDVFEQHMLLQVQGKHPSLPLVLSRSAVGYANHALSLIKDPLVQAQLSPTVLEAAQNAITASRTAFTKAAPSNKVLAHLQANKQPAASKAAAPVPPAATAAATDHEGVATALHDADASMAAALVPSAAAAAPPSPVQDTVAMDAYPGPSPVAAEAAVAAHNQAAAAGDAAGAAAVPAAAAATAARLSNPPATAAVAASPAAEAAAAAAPTGLTGTPQSSAGASLGDAKAVPAAGAAAAPAVSEPTSLPGMTGPACNAYPRQAVPPAAAAAAAAAPQYDAASAAEAAPAAAATGRSSLPSLPRLFCKTAVLQDPPQAAAAPPPAAAAAAGGSSSLPAIPAVPSDGDLVTAQRHLLWLYTEKMRPSLQQQLRFRSTVWQVLSADDTRRALFWRDYDWLLVLSSAPDSQPEHFEEAFETLLANAGGLS